MQASDAEVEVLVNLLAVFKMMLQLYWREFMLNKMSVLFLFDEMQRTQCPLCMEQLEIDDVNFFPCTCGYQVMKYSVLK